MPIEPEKSLPVTYTPEFKRCLRMLAKKYRHIREDIQPTIDQLAEAAKPGEKVT